MQASDLRESFAKSKLVCQVNETMQYWERRRRRKGCVVDD
jgi:hypothetical protein